MNFSTLTRQLFFNCFFSSLIALKHTKLLCKKKLFLFKHVFYLLTALNLVYE